MTEAQPAESAGQPLDATVQASAALLGNRFLAYVCGIDEARIENRLRGATLKAPQEHVLKETLELASALLAQRRTMNVNQREVLEPASETLAGFANFSPDHGTGIANALRQASGAELPSVGSADRLKGAVRRIALDWFPALLIPQEEVTPWSPSPFAFRVTSFYWKHPAFEDLVAAVNEADEPLRQLFPPREEVTELTSSKAYMSSAGQGGSVQMGTLVSTLLSGAETRAQFDAVDTAEGFLEIVDSQIDELRKLVAGRSVEVPAAVGLASLQADEDFRLETPWGLLRTATAWDRRRAPTGATLVLVTTFSLQIQLGVDLSPESGWSGPPPGFLDAHQDLERRVDLTRLMLLLGLDREQPPAVAQTWRHISDPLNLGGFSWGMASPVLIAGSVGNEDAPSLEKWGELIDERYHPSLGLAVRRTLSSIAMRHDPADGIVDAVVALENLFGTGQSEVGFRLSAALAWLLEGDPQARVARHKAVNDLYGLRSGIVHGRDLSPDELYPRRIEASQLAVESLRKLFEHHADLIAAGDQRGKRLILEGRPSLIDEAPEASP